jgi:hypothetical protein
MLTAALLMSAALYLLLKHRTAECGKALGRVAAKDVEIAGLNDKHRLDLAVKAAELVSVRRELTNEIEALHRQVYKLETVAEAKKRYDYCHKCDQPKGQPQVQSSVNGQRVRGNGRVHAIVNGEE